MPTALVTGVAGFVGSNLAIELLDRGYTVRGIDNLSTGRLTNLDPIIDRDQFRFQEGDIRDADAVARLADGAEVLFHQAAAVSVPESIEDPTPTTDINCTGTATVLDVASRSTIETTVLASSAAVYGSSADPPVDESIRPAPESPYAASKLYTEHLASQYNEFHDLQTVALRYFNIFGPRQNPDGEYAAVIPAFIDAMLDGERPTIFGDGEQTRDFVAIDDVVQANLCAAKSDASGTFNVGCGRPISINGLVETLNDLLGTNVDPRYDDPRPGDIRHSHADISKARNQLAYTPSTTFEAGLELTIEWYR